VAPDVTGDARLWWMVPMLVVLLLVLGLLLLI